MNVFLTVLSSDKYLLGVLALYKSLFNTGTKYPFYVAITNDISKESIAVLENDNINIIKLDSNIQLPEEIKNKNTKSGYSQWNNTLQKLSIFQLTRFKKIVYLDSDMLILNNIDELFNKKHMSAVVAGALIPGREEWKLLNSGLMVIEPKKNLGTNIAKTIDIVSKNKEYFGDQDLIQEYYNEWCQNKDLQLSHKYNVFIKDLEFYCKKCNYNTKKNNNNSISVVHFVGEKKPWMLSKNELLKYLLSLIKNTEFNTLKVYLKYLKLLSISKKEKVI
jgi:glycogenin glucosyltransferase